MKSWFSLLLPAAALGLCLACASAPKPALAASAPGPSPAPAQNQAQVPAKAAVPAPDALKAQASALRKKAFDYDLKTYLSGDYAVAEADFQAGSSSYGQDNAASTDSFGKAVAEYQTLIAKGLPLVADKRAQEAQAMRTAALGKGADSLFPDSYQALESEYQKHLSDRDGGRYEDAITGFQSSTMEYSVLYTLCEASASRDKIVARDFAKWDSSNWNLAEGRFGTARSLLTSDAKAASDAAGEAKLRYGLVWQNALEYYAGDRKAAAASQDQRALGIKADVAVKDEYAKAKELSDEAAAKAAAKDFDDAARLYDQSAAAFGSAYDDAKAKLDTAVDELGSLDEALAARGVVLPAGQAQ